MKCLQKTWPHTARKLCEPWLYTTSVTRVQGVLIPNPKEGERTRLAQSQLCIRHWFIQPWSMGTWPHKSDIEEKLLPTLGVWGVNSTQKWGCGPLIHHNKCLLYHPFPEALTSTQVSKATFGEAAWYCGWECRLHSFTSWEWSLAPGCSIKLNLGASLLWLINRRLHPSWARLED